MFLLQTILFLLFSFILLYFIVPYILKKYYFKRSKELNSKRTIYLTFDDGPHPKYTPKVLNILKKYNVKATFFLLGENAEKNPEIVDKIKKEGHTIGIHGYKHIHGWFSFPLTYLIDLIKAERCFKKISDNKKRIYLFRPAFGKINFFTLIYVFLTKKKIVLWNLDTKDYEKKTKEDAINNLKSKIGNSSLLLMHDNRLYKNQSSIDITIDILDYIFNNLKKENIYKL